MGLLSANLSLFLGSAAAFAAPQNHTDKADSSNPVRIAIVGATLINPAKSQVLENAIVTIEGNRILAVAHTTVNAGKVFAKDSEIGTIDPGMLADLVILRANPLVDIHNASEIETVIKDGVEHPAIDLLEETPTDIVQRQVNAYNAKNMEAFMITYSSDAKVFQYPDLLLAAGREEIRKRYEHLFAGTRPLHAQILQRISAGRTVIDQERLTGLPDAKTSEGFAIYDVTDRLIRNVTLIPTGE